MRPSVAALQLSALRRGFILTVEHAGSTSVVGPMWDITIEEAVERLQALKRRDESLVKGTAIVDYGKPKYRLWKLEGTCEKEDVS